MNLVPGTLVPAAVGAGVRVGGERGAVVPIDTRHAAALASGARDLLLGVRPEHLRVGAAGAAPNDALAMQVELVEPLGHESLVHLRGTGGVELTARVAGVHPFAAGETVAVRVDPAHVRLFEAGGEGRSIRPGG